MFFYELRQHQSHALAGTHSNSNRTCTWRLRNVELVWYAYSRCFLDFRSPTMARTSPYPHIAVPLVMSMDFAGKYPASTLNATANLKCYPVLLGAWGRQKRPRRYLSHFWKNASRSGEDVFYDTKDALLTPFQFVIFDSHHSEVVLNRECFVNYWVSLLVFAQIMLFSLNMPMCSTTMAESFFPKHPMVNHLNSQHNYFNPFGVSETSYGAACDS